jgi:pentatricopeptide repeat protein
MALSKLTMKPFQNLSKSIKANNPFSIFTKNLCGFPLDSRNITNDLISIFTKQPFSPNNPELESLAPLLNTKVVETVLNGLKNWKIALHFFTWASNQGPYKHNVYAYNAMASILSRARQKAPLRALSMDVVNSRCLMSPGALGFLIRCLGNAGLVVEANLLFDQVQKMGLCVPNSYSYTCLLEVLSKSICIDLLEMRLKEMHDHGWGFDKYTLTPVLQVYCNMDEFDKALDVFNEIHDRGWVDEYVFSILVLAFSKWGKVDKACELIETMEEKNVRLNKKTFCSLIYGFVKESRVDKALHLFDKMKKSGFTPDISLYDVIIGGLCVNKDVKKALCLYSEMKGFKIQPDVKIVTKLISSFSKEEELTCFFEEMHEDMDPKASTLLYNSVLNSLVDNGSVHKAYHLLQAITIGNCIGDGEIGKLFRGKAMVPPNSTTFSIVINGLIKTGDLDLAVGLFRDMARIGCKPDLLLYNNLIDGLCTSNRLQESCGLLQEMEESGIEPTSFTNNCIFGCLCRRHDISGALHLLKKMRIHGHVPWIKHSTSLVKELCKHGKEVEACKFLVDMAEEGFQPDIVAYSACLDGLIKIREVDQALKLFQDICAQGYCPDVIAYNILIKGLCKTQRIAEAQNLLHEMEEKGLVPSAVTYNTLIDGLCKTDHLEEAMLFLSMMIEKEREPNVITYSTLINGLCNAGRPDDALVLWNEMGRKGCTPSSIAYMAFIHGLSNCGRPNEALVYLREMEEREMKPDTYVYVGLLSAFLVDSNQPLAFEILQEMVDKGKFPDLHDKNHISVRNAILKFSEDARTSSSIKNLLAKGSIPSASLSVTGITDGVEPAI